MLLQILCISFLFFTFVWEEYHVSISHYLNKMFQAKVFDWAETHDTDSESESEDEDDEDGDEGAEGAEGDEEAEDNEEGEGAANANLRHRIVERAEDTAAIERATREIQQSLLTTM
jgi:hypothetical protein